MNGKTTEMSAETSSDEEDKTQVPPTDLRIHPGSAPVRRSRPSTPYPRSPIDRQRSVNEDVDGEDDTFLSGHEEDADAVADAIQSPSRGRLRDMASARGQFSNSLMRIFVHVINQRDAFNRSNIEQDNRNRLKRMYFLSDVTAIIVQAVRTTYMAAVLILGILWVLEATGKSGDFAPDADLVCVSNDPGSTETCGTWKYGAAHGALLLFHCLVLVYSYGYVRWRTDTMNIRWLRTTATTYVALAGVYAQLPSTTATTLVSLFLAIFGCCAAAWMAERSRGHGMTDAQIGAKFVSVTIAVTLCVIGLMSVYDASSRFNRLILVIANGALVLSTANIVRIRDRFSSSASQREMNDLALIVGNATLDIMVLVTGSVLAIHSED